MKKKVAVIAILFLMLNSGFLKAQIIDFSTHITVVNNTKTVKKEFLIQVNSKESNYLSDIKIYHGANQSFDLIEAYIIDRNGNIVRKIKKKEVVTVSDISYGTFYNDDFVSEFSLNWNSYPYQIKYAYQIKESEFFSLVNWSPVVYSNLETKHAELKVTLPLDYKVNYNNDDRLELTSNSNENEQILKWEIDNFKIGKKQLWSPPIYTLIPTVNIVPEKFFYGVNGIADSWGNYGKWHNDLNLDAYALTASEKRTVNTILHGIQTPIEKVKTLYHYLQDNTRYINVAIDVGGLKPYPASYVCVNKYGDCKALTVYMQAMLKYVGIPSYYTIIKAGDEIEPINTALPSQQFNHVILCVPIEGDTLWLENTSNTSPFNYLGTFTQNRMALLVDNSGSRLVKTPALGLNDVLEKRILTYSLNETGTGKLEVKQALKGDEFEFYKYYHSTQSDRKIEEQIQENLDFKNFTLDNWTIEQVDRDSNTINVNFNGNCTNQFRKVNELIAVQFPTIPIPLFEKPAQRKYPVNIDYPINILDSIVYNLPFLENYNVTLPDAVKFNTPFGEYLETYKKKKDQLVIKLQFKLYAGVHELSEYEAFYDFLAQIKKYQKKSAIVLTP